jgi:BlaI family transcriptional regulator, penicillinase repressor
MRPRSTTLTDQELEIMKIVWQLEKATVRDVYEALLERRKIAYTTVMTMMKILEQKQYLKKTLEDRAYIYCPTKPKNQVIRGMVREFVDRVFNGSAQPLLLHLVEDRCLTEKELREIERSIAKTQEKKS